MGTDALSFIRPDFAMPEPPLDPHHWVLPGKLQACMIIPCKLVVSSDPKPACFPPCVCLAGVPRTSSGGRVQEGGCVRRVEEEVG